jgi:two-component system cell cycle response regulator
MSINGDGLRLLLVDDEPIQRKFLEVLLKSEGYAVETANDGEEALQKILSGTFHILITDWEMPGMDGKTLCRRVREANLPAYLYTLMLTGNTSEADVVAGLEAGADDYLRKPPNKPELLARLSAGKRVVQLERSLRAANEQIQKLSVTDPLCSIYNRRYLDDRLAQEIDRARRYDRPLSLVLADLDLFKRVNDEHGHAIGDEVLRHFASVCLDSLRVNDWVARYGGEEFVVVLPETELAGAAVVAEKIRSCCATVPASTSAGHVSVTASFGVAQLSPDVQLLRAADAALYTSKREGRNRVTLAAFDD